MPGESGLVPRSEAQRKRLVLQSARVARRWYRRADTTGEVLERWLDRQINRKTRIMPAEVQRGVKLFQQYFQQVRQLEVVLSDLAYTSSQV
jgi:hypothetical protein